MRVTLVTQGASATVLLEQLVASSPQLRDRGIEVKDGEGVYGVFSMARTILSVRHEPVAVVIGTDTDDPEEVAEDQVLFEGLLGEAAPASEWRLVLLAPRLEALLLGCPEPSEALGESGPLELSSLWACEELRPLREFLLEKCAPSRLETLA